MGGNEERAFSAVSVAFSKGAYFILSFSLLRERKYGKERGARGIPISPGPLKAAKKPPSVFLDLSRAKSAESRTPLTNDQRGSALL